jgi:hypothetical protein
LIVIKTVPPFDLERIAFKLSLPVKSQNKTTAQQLSFPLLKYPE